MGTKRVPRLTCWAWPWRTRARFSSQEPSSMPRMATPADSSPSSRPHTRSRGFTATSTTSWPRLKGKESAMEILSEQRRKPGPAAPARLAREHLADLVGVLELPTEPGPFQRAQARMRAGQDEGLEVLRQIPAHAIVRLAEHRPVVVAGGRDALDAIQKKAAQLQAKAVALHLAAA